MMLACFLSAVGLLKLPASPFANFYAQTATLSTLIVWAFLAPLLYLVCAA
mgnify:FL=1